MEPGWERDVEFHKKWDLCLRGGDGGGGIDASGGGGGVDGNGGSSGVGDSGENIERIVYRSGGGGRSMAYRGGGEGLYRSD